MSNFHEKITRLVGSTTYREPMGGVSTVPGQMPGAHVVAAALACARRGDDDIGPDLAVCIYLHSDYKRGWIVRTVADAFASDRDRIVRQNRQFLRWMADQAFAHLVHGVGAIRPEAMKPLHWARLYPVVCHVMNSEAEDAVNRAAQIERAA